MREADDEGEWNLVIEAKAQRKKKRREQQLQQQTKRTVALSTRRCGHREFCQNAASFYAKGEGDGCGYRHTNGEQAFFKKHKQALRLLKTIACCNQNPEHKRRLQDPMCAFLHDGEEMLCKVCFHLPCLGGEECRAEGEMRPAVDSNSQHFKDLMKAVQLLNASAVQEGCFDCKLLVWRKSWRFRSEKFQGAGLLLIFAFLEPLFLCVLLASANFS